MNSFGRTKSNKTRLKLKSFFRVPIKPDNIINIVRKEQPQPVKIGVGKWRMKPTKGRIGTSYEGLSYLLESDSKTQFGYNLRIVLHFRKSQLLGKLFIIGGIRYHIRKRL